MSRDDPPVLVALLALLGLAVVAFASGAVWLAAVCVAADLAVWRWAGGRAPGGDGPCDLCCEMGHVFPHSRGGSDEPGNLVAECGSCNAAQGNRTPEEWAAGVDVWSEARPRAEIPEWVRAAVFARDGGVCGGRLPGPFCRRRLHRFADRHQVTAGR